MKKITELDFDNTYRRLPEDFYQIIRPSPFQDPHLVCFNTDAASLIELDPREADKREFAEYICGIRQIPGSEPIAMYYTGHQFGVYNPRIGDGRAILLGEVRNLKGEKWDLHLKGAGRTRYAREFDGRAVLRSTIREYLCSEAMYGLGIPTTRALCIIGSDEKVHRENVETGAMLVRMAKSHVRFGSFEAFFYKDRDEYIKLLADYVINHHYPHLKHEEKKYKLFLHEVVERTAKLISMWQATGFTHGVVNTDNMSILGITIDYGPFGFIEEYNPEYIPNHSDHFGRYSFENQSSIAFWNLKKFAQTLISLVSRDEVIDALDKYKSTFKETYLNIMRKKLGFFKNKDEDFKLIQNMLSLLQAGKVDYTNFFRRLSDFSNPENVSKNALRNMFIDGSLFDKWEKMYVDRLKAEKIDKLRRKKTMDNINPKYILRSYLAELAIRKAVDNSDYSEISRLHQLLSNPYSELAEYNDYSNPPPDWARNWVVSCSS